ncbi:MAG: histidinol-phosphate transaminase [Candidatus Thermoplasmatota archaeon]|mgnify:CR=1 FL=1
MIWRPELSGVSYEEAAMAGVDLASNTNLFGVNPAAARPVPDAERYPEANSPLLRAAAAAHYGVPASHVAAASGTDQVLDLLFRALLRPGQTVAFAEPTFSMVPIHTIQNHGKPMPVPLDARRLAEGDVSYLARPNNPDGAVVDRAFVRDLVERARFTILDEAYIEYLGDSFSSWVLERPNLAVLRTLSKAHGLAGLRVGFGLMEPGLAAVCNAMGGPYKLSRHSETVAAQALQDTRFMQSSVAATKRELPIWAAALAKRGFTVAPSGANFLFARSPVQVPALEAALRSRGYRIRTFKGPLSNHVRITVGPADVREAFLDALDVALGAAKA